MGPGLIYAVRSQRVRRSPCQRQAEQPLCEGRAGVALRSLRKGQVSETTEETGLGTLSS